MITEREDDGLLIDLDLAVRLDRQEASGAPSKTGTKVFMAIGALYGEPHSFMHDLESFVWVLFWICVQWDGPGKKRKIKEGFENWNYKPTDDLANEKAGRISEEFQFNKEVAGNFTTYCQPLVPCIQELHKVVFPNGKRWRTEDKGLFGQMKAVLEKARGDPEVLRTLQSKA